MSDYEGVILCLGIWTWHFDTTESGFAVGYSSYSLVCFKLRGLSTGKATDAELFTICDNFKYQWSGACHFLFVCWLDG